MLRPMSSPASARFLRTSRCARRRSATTAWASPGMVTVAVASPFGSGEHRNRPQGCGRRTGERDQVERAGRRRQAAESARRRPRAALGQPVRHAVDHAGRSERPRHPPTSSPRWTQSPRAGVTDGAWPGPEAPTRLWPGGRGNVASGRARAIDRCLGAAWPRPWQRSGRTPPDHPSRSSRSCP